LGNEKEKKFEGDGAGKMLRFSTAARKTVMVQFRLRARPDEQEILRFA
jgi:hypothetical protein